MELFQSLMRSDTFWSETVFFGCISLMLLLLSILVLIVRKPNRKRLTNVFTDTNGSAAAVDFVLTFPIVMVVVLVAVQYALLANASLVVHYAAYSAARSARVYAFDTYTDRFTRILRNTGNGSAFLYYMRNRNRVKDRALMAARLPLVAISPASKAVKSKQPKSADWKNAKKLVDILAKDTPKSDKDALYRKAYYAFDAKNLKVDTGLLFDISSMSSGKTPFQKGIDEWPVRAEVSYRFYLYLPVSRFFGDVADPKTGKRGPWRWLSAEVKLL